MAWFRILGAGLVSGAGMRSMSRRASETGLERELKCHANIRLASKLPHVVTLCCFRRRPGLNECPIEEAVFDALRWAGWQVFPVLAEVLGGKRKAEKGALDGVGFEPLVQGKNSFVRFPWWIEIKRGDRDLTPEQLDQVRLAPSFGCRVLITDESSLVRDWLRGRG